MPDRIEVTGSDYVVDVERFDDGQEHAEYPEFTVGEDGVPEIVPLVEPTALAAILQEAISERVKQIHQENLYYGQIEMAGLEGLDPGTLRNLSKIRVRSAEAGNNCNSIQMILEELFHFRDPKAIGQYIEEQARKKYKEQYVDGRMGV